ncbi:MAG: hypothetical protein KatS3mg076_1042 [Candidatus Binatia bacterium]|nr:MAG: hypothetical protein KatS3mg076_1042 [Candidatus Binatia bacterium]
MRRVAVLLELDGERAPAFRPQRETEHAPEGRQRGAGEAVPLDGRIGARVRGGQELSVFHVEEAPDEKGRDVFERSEKPLSRHAPVDERTGPGPYLEADGRLLVERRRNSGGHELGEFRGHFRLCRDPEAAFLESGSKTGNLRVAPTFVERTPSGIGDSRARTRPEFEGEALRVRRKEPRLDRRSLEFVSHERTHADRAREFRGSHRPPHDPAERRRRRTGRSAPEGSLPEQGVGCGRRQLGKHGFFHFIKNRTGHARRDPSFPAPFRLRQRAERVRIAGLGAVSGRNSAVGGTSSAGWQAGSLGMARRSGIAGRLLRVPRLPAEWLRDRGLPYDSPCLPAPYPEKEEYE